MSRFLPAPPTPGSHLAAVLSTLVVIGILIGAFATWVVVSQPPPAHRPDLGSAVPLRVAVSEIGRGGSLQATTDASAIRCGPDPCQLMGSAPANSLLIADTRQGDVDTYAALSQGTLSLVHVQTAGTPFPFTHYCCPGVAVVPPLVLYAIPRSALPRGSLVVQRVEVNERWAAQDQVYRGESVTVDLS